jgi:hypothetical protein
LDLIGDQTPVARERLLKADLIREGHYRHFIFGLEAFDRLDGRGADLFIEGVYATGSIHQKQNRNWLFAPAEVRHGLLYTILEQHNVILGEVGQNAPGLFLDGKQVDDDQIGSQPESLLVGGRLLLLRAKGKESNNDYDKLKSYKLIHGLDLRVGFLWFWAESFRISRLHEDIIFRDAPQVCRLDFDSRSQH